MTRQYPVTYARRRSPRDPEVLYLAEHIGPRHHRRKKSIAWLEAWRHPLYFCLFAVLLVTAIQCAAGGLVR